MRKALIRSTPTFTLVETGPVPHWIRCCLSVFWGSRCRWSSPQMTYFDRLCWKCFLQLYFCSFSVPLFPGRASSPPSRVPPNPHFLSSAPCLGSHTERSTSLDAAPVNSAQLMPCVPLDFGALRSQIASPPRQEFHAPHFCLLQICTKSLVSAD